MRDNNKKKRNIRTQNRSAQERMSSGNPPDTNHVVFPRFGPTESRLVLPPSPPLFKVGAPENKRSGLIPKLEDVIYGLGLTDWIILSHYE